jgi:hypothetical protein
VLLALAAGLIVWEIWGAPFLAQESCLDAGGSWRDGTCVGAPDLP